MAETAEAQVEDTAVVVEDAPVATEQSPPTPTPATAEPADGAEKIATILAAVDANPTLAEDPEIKAVLDLAKPEAGKTEEAKTEAKTEEGKTEEGKTEAKTEEGKEAKTEEGKTEAKTEEGKEEAKTEEGKEEKSSSVFFKDEEKPEEKIELKDLDAFNSHIKEKYSIEDPSKFFDSVDKWRNGAQSSEKAQSELDDVTDAFAKMPDQLYSAFVNWSKGEDWTKAVQGAGALDFKLGFGEYDTHSIVNHYFPGEYTKEDFTGENKDSVTTKRAVNLAKTQYESDKQAVEGQRADLLQDAEDQKDLIKTSSASSVEDLKQTFPGIGKAELKKVQNIMASGDLTAMFFTKDGGYVKDAAKKIAMALFADKEIANANKRTKSSQAALIEKVDGGNKKPSTTTSTQGKKSAVPEEVTNLFADLQETKTY